MTWAVKCRHCSFTMTNIDNLRARRLKHIHEMYSGHVTVLSGPDGDETDPEKCGRTGCNRLAERSVQRTDTGSTAYVCSACAKHLVSSTPGLEYWHGNQKETQDT